MPVLEGGYGPYQISGSAPVGGTDEVQTLTISASSGTFKLRYEGFTTAAVTWTSDNTTLIAAIDSALEALPSVGTGGVATAVGSMTSGVGTATITFSGANLAKRAVSSIAVASSTLTGASATVSVAKTTTGVNATFRNAKPGALLVRTDGSNAKLYQNIGATQGAPNWQLVGAQT